MSRPHARRSSRGAPEGSVSVETVVIVPAALIPVVYSFLHYKALERRGEV